MKRGGVWKEWYRERDADHVSQREETREGRRKGAETPGCACLRSAPTSSVG